VVVAAIAPTQATVALAHRQPLCSGAATTAANAAAHAGGRASRGWQPLVGVLQSAPLAGTAMEANVPVSSASAHRRRPYGLLPQRAAVAPCGCRLPPLRAGPGRSRSPPLVGAMAAAWPWATGPAWGLARVGRPSSLLPSLRKCSKNA
ncbi:hypothetical protein BHM03_00048496, partial [Ensete ventricosum]